MKDYLISMKNYLKLNWYKYTSWTRLKINDHDFKELLFNHEHKNTPQAIQGQWQAYGQMRAARTTGRFAVLTTGIFGLGLWAFQQLVSTQKKELDKQEKEVKKDQDVVAFLKLENEKHQEMIQKAEEIIKKIDLFPSETEKKYYSQFEQFKKQKENEYNQKMANSNVLRQENDENISKKNIKMKK